MSAEYGSDFSGVVEAVVLAARDGAKVFTAVASYFVDKIERPEQTPDLQGTVLRAVRQLNAAGADVIACNLRSVCQSWHGEIKPLHRNFEAYQELIALQRQTTPKRLQLVWVPRDRRALAIGSMTEAAKT